MNRLKELREFHALTQLQCAQIAYISKKAYERYEKGERIMPLDTAVYFAKFYRVSLDYISGLTDNTSSPVNDRKKDDYSDIIKIDAQLLLAIKRLSEKQQRLLANFLNSIQNERRLP